MSLKDTVLRALLENKEIYISGENLAKGKSVSRNAVWKVIQDLRSEGYVIEASSKKGYRLIDSDVLSEEEIQALIQSPYIPEVSVYNSIDSTNNEAKRRAAIGSKEPQLILANAQTGGRGRLGRSFYSPQKTGLYMSMLYRTNAPIESTVTITTAASVAVALSIEEMCDKKTSIKWVNDVYIEDKKVCGILTEALVGLDGGSENTIIVGIGVNITTNKFPSELTEKAAGTGKLNGPRNELAARIYNKLIKYAKLPKDKSYMDEYRKRSNLIGKKISITNDGERIIGLAAGISDDGGLIFLPDGCEISEVLRSSSISVRLLE